jgi:6-pyruvoyltetrahydropterin/6-carboxytetrahydropterin synthase
MFSSTKRLGPISVAHRQWRDEGHCSYVHGYGRIIQFTFTCTDLDAKMWVVDFGGLKDIRKWLESEWDHRLLIASDDPHLKEFETLHEKGLVNLNVMDVTKGYGPGIEGSCKYVYDNVNPMIDFLTEGRCKIAKVEIWEHENNSAFYKPE